jgi:signal transduction histidine kinase
MHEDTAGKGLTLLQPRRRRGLLAKYATYSGLLVSTLLVVSGAVGGYFSWHETIATQGALLAGNAASIAIRIAHFLADIEHPLAWTSASAALNARLDPQEVRIQMIELLRRAPAISEARWLDADGRERVLVSRLALDALDSGSNLASDPRFRAAMERGRVVSPVYFLRGTEPYLSLAVTSPPRRGVLLAEVNLKFVWDVIARERIGETGTAYVVDRRGQLVSHPDISLVLRKTDYSLLAPVRAALEQPRGSPATARLAKDAHGTDVMWAAAPVEGLEWTVVVEQPTREALAPVYRSLGRTAILVLLGLAASIAASVLLARHMVRPIHALERGAERIGAGELAQRIDVHTGDELEALGAQFNRMAVRLREIHATLETRIAERTRELAAANEAKTRFLAAASHDLRQPMHALALFVGQLRDAAEGAPALKGLVQHIETSVGALQELLDALLDLSKLDAGAVVPARSVFALQPVLDRLSTSFTAAAEEKGLALRVTPTSLWIDSDPRLLERILLNLVANAVRYTENGRILIGCRRRGVLAEIIVADSGIGIPAAHLPFVFQEFYQVGNPAPDKARGIGLGLAIVARLTQLLGHRLSVQSQVGRGSLFGVSVPVAPARAAGLEAVPSIGTELAGCRVLVVDDDGPAREAMIGLLQRWGCAAAAATDRGMALAAAATVMPDVVICDLRLRDGEDGFAVIDALRAHCSVPPVVVILTGDLAPELMREASARGYSILHKPTRPAKLRALLEQQLAERAGT